MLPISARRAPRRYTPIQPASGFINVVRLLRGRLRTALEHANAGLLTPDLFALVRNHIADWLMLGGVLVMPVAAVLAVVGAITPPRSAFHQHVGDVFAFAAVWFIAALFAAQFQRRRASDSALD